MPLECNKQDLSHCTSSSSIETEINATFCCDCGSVSLGIQIPSDSLSGTLVWFYMYARRCFVNILTLSNFSHSACAIVLWLVRRQMILHTLCNSVLHESRPPFSHSSFSLFFLSLPSLQNTCYFSRVEPRRGELQKVCNIYLLPFCNILCDEWYVDFVQFKYNVQNQHIIHHIKDR